MGGASSQSLFCYCISVQHHVFLTWAKETLIGCNDAGSWIFGNKHETAKNVCEIFMAAKTFLDVVTCKIKYLQNICKNVLEPQEVDGSANVLFYM